MNNFEVSEVLSTMELLVDTREQATPKAIQRYKTFGVPYSRATLGYGDYTANFVINGKPLYDTSKAITPMCIVERKMNLDELAMCFTRDRDRFEKEFQRAIENKAFIHLIVEDGSYEKILGNKYKSKFNSKAFMASLNAWERRYNIHVHFCSSMTSGMLIKDLLYRDMKERLEKGDFDIGT
jgi:hypothetical protein